MPAQLFGAITTLFGESGSALLFGVSVLKIVLVSDINLVFVVLTSAVLAEDYHTFWVSHITFLLGTSLITLLFGMSVMLFFQSGCHHPTGWVWCCHTPV